MIRTFVLTARTSDPNDTVAADMFGHLENVFRKLILMTHVSALGMTFCVEKLEEVVEPEGDIPCAGPVEESTEAATILARIAKLRKKSIGEREES